MFLCVVLYSACFFFFSSRRRHTRCSRDWSSDVCSSDLQTRGTVVDKRTDIWAFGAVLYEMLSGRKAFAGDTVRSEERRVGKGVDLGGRRIIKKKKRRSRRTI